MIKSSLNWVFVIFVLIFIVATSLKLFGIIESYQQFVAVLLSACATYVIVSITMTNQTKQQQALIEKKSADEENKDKNIRIYEKKLEVYSRFNALLWKCSDPKSFEKVADMCMQELIFSISNDKVKDLAKLLNEAKINCETLDKAKESYAAITNLLKSDLLDSEENEDEKKDILSVFDAVNVPEDELSPENSNIVSNNAIVWKRKEIEDIWTKFESGQLRCWHFNAWEVEKQRQTLESENKFLSLIEYGEQWRTERLKQVQSGDIVFLFNRGGAGYVGMYRALGTIVLRNEDNGIYISEDGNTDIPITQNDATKYDIYSAIEDGASFVSNIKVEPIILRTNTWNPIGTMRQTIVRPNGDNVWELLKYFDSEDKANI